MNPLAHLLLGALATGSLLSGCKLGFSLGDLDELARTAPARTIVLEQDFSLYSPFAINATREYVSIVREQTDEIFSLFGVRSPEPFLVHLREDESLDAELSVVGDQVRIDAFSRSPQDNLLGWVGDEIVVRVAAVRHLRLADGREVDFLPAASQYADTVRHELTHLAARLTGLRLTPWLSEGLAHAVEWIPLAGGRFVLAPLPPALERAARLPREPRTLEHLLAWQQAYPVTNADRDARLLGLALAVFLFERDPAPFVDALPRISTLEGPELLALEPAWTAWLAELSPED